MTETLNPGPLCSTYTHPRHDNCALLNNNLREWQRGEGGPLVYRFKQYSTRFQRHVVVQRRGETANFIKTRERSVSSEIPLGGGLMQRRRSECEVINEYS